MANSGNPGPSRAWFILPSVLLFAGGLLAAIGISSFVSFVRSDLSSYQPSSSISVIAEGFTLYTEEGTTGAADLDCTATGPGGPVQLPAVSGRTALSNGQGRFQAVASTPPDLPPGRYLIACRSVSAAADVQLYIGPRVDLAAVGRLAVFGIIAPLFLGLCAVVLFAILSFLRYRSRSKSAVG